MLAERHRTIAWFLRFVLWVLCFLAVAVCVSMVGLVVVRVGVWGFLAQTLKAVISGIVTVVFICLAFGLTALSAGSVYNLSKKVGFRYPNLSAICCGFLTMILILTGITWAKSGLHILIQF